MLFKKKYLLLCVYVYTYHGHYGTHVWRSENHFQEFSFPTSTSSGTNLGLASLGNKYFYFLRQVANPGNCFNSKKRKKKEMFEHT